MAKHVYYTYIMASSSRNLYIGVTSNLEHRVAQHKEGILGGFTARYNDTTVIASFGSNDIVGSDKPSLVRKN
jgi:putative endonuclease